MSFIFGIVNLDETPVSQENISDLGFGVKWDEFSVHTEREGHIALGYCRHPQRRPKAGIFHNKEVIVLADIRLYNHEELKKSFGYHTPEEALAKAYLEWGTDFANHINGDFAVMVFDRRTNQAHLLRDHIGARPLAYWFSNRKLIFASHEYGLARSSLFPVSLSEEKLVNDLFLRKGNYQQTAFEQIRKVKPGHCLTFTAKGQPVETKYWKPENIQKDKTLSFEAAVTRLRELLIRATCTRMEPVKTGLHVSGGIDSCGIASIVAGHATDKGLLTGYSWTPETFSDPVEGVNEKEFIDAFSEDKAVSVKYVSTRENETVKNAMLPEFPVQHIEHPVMQMAGKEGIEILFSGWGGDEFVSLSTRGTVNHLFFTFKWITLLQYARERGLKHTLFQLRSDVLPLLIPFGLLPVYRSGFTNWSLLRLLKTSFIRRHLKQIFFHRRRNIFGYGNRTRFARNLINLYHLPNRMDFWAINAERYGFEYKYPLLDKDALEFWFSIPVEYTYKDFQSRLLYREAMKGILTEKIRTRKDKGEALRIAFSFKEQLEGKKYLAELFHALPEKDHLPFFRPRAFNKVINMPPSKEPIKNWREINKLIFYLRYVALVKKYLSGQDLTKPINYSREILHARHRLSHQQIDRMLNENRGAEFVQEKLQQLDRLRKFLELTDQLRQNQIPFICIKGPLLSLRIYNDPTIRISHDIDLLIDMENLEHATTVLKEQGYQLTAGAVWSEETFRRELLADVTHHISLWNSRLQHCVELHWTLTYKLSLTKQKIKEITRQNRTTIALAGRSFTVLNPEMELLYLIIHGARHGWNRLKWLTDIHAYPMHMVDAERFCRLAEQLKAERLVAQTNFLLNEYFSDSQKLPDPWQKRIPLRMIRYARQSIGQATISPNWPLQEIIRNFRYTWLLFPGIRYKTQWLSGIFVRGGDLAEQDFSSKAAYYLYRPYSFIKRRIING